MSGGGSPTSGGVFTIRHQCPDLAGTGLPGQDSNLDSHIQSVESYHWTTRHSARRVAIKGTRWKRGAEPERSAGAANGPRSERRNAYAVQPGLLTPSIGAVRGAEIH